MVWVHRLSAENEQPADVLGSKGYGLNLLHRLGLPVPPGFIISTLAGRALRRDGRWPDGLADETAAAVRELAVETGRRPLVVSVRSGGAVSMPGMMSTILNLGLDPEDPLPPLEVAVTAVFRSWDTPRARMYRELNDIPHDLGTAVTVQSMVFGDRGEHSGSGVAFSRDPNTGAPSPYGEVLFGHQGEDVVSGRSLTLPLAALAEREPAVWAGLADALRRIEAHYRDASSVEFTFEQGTLWLLQVRPGRFVGRAAVRVAVDLAVAGVISRSEAVRRFVPAQLGLVRVPRLATTDDGEFARGVGACPGVATGRVATTADAAARMVAEGPVILVRPETSPLDLHGLAAAAGVVTARGGPASHAAVVARSMGKPAVVGVEALTVDGSSVRAAGRTVGEGELITIDGTGGEVVLGRAGTVTGTDEPYLERLLAWADEISGDHTSRPEADRLRAAHAVLDGK